MRGVAPVLTLQVSSRKVTSRCGAGLRRTSGRGQRGEGQGRADGADLHAADLAEAVPGLIGAVVEDGVNVSLLLPCFSPATMCATSPPSLATAPKSP